MNEQTPSSEPSTQQLLDNARASMLSFYHASKDCCIAIEKLRDALAKEQFPHLAQLLDLGKLAEISKTGGLAMVEARCRSTWSSTTFSKLKPKETRRNHEKQIPPPM
jgi:hypothetical protein